MASNNFSNITNDNQGYNFNGSSAFYQKCTSEQQSSSYTTNHALGMGLSGPGAQLEETTPPVTLSSIKSRGRGRRKQKKKVSCPENLVGEAMKHDPIIESQMRNSESVLIPRIQEDIPEMLYPTNAVPEESNSLENQLLFNSNTLDQVLSYKKMMLLQSPEVLEFLKKQQSGDDKK